MNNPRISGLCIAGACLRRWLGCWRESGFCSILLLNVQIYIMQINFNWFALWTLPLCLLLLLLLLLLVMLLFLRMFLLPLLLLLLLLLLFLWCSILIQQLVVVVVVVLVVVVVVLQTTTIRRLRCFPVFGYTNSGNRRLIFRTA